MQRSAIQGISNGSEFPIYGEKHEKQTKNLKP